MLYSYINSSSCLLGFHLQNNTSFNRLPPLSLQNHHLIWCLLNCKELLIPYVSPSSPTVKIMKQEIVIKVKVNGPKSRSKALQIVVGLSGVESAGLGGRDKSQIEVVGDGVDAVELVSLLRKKVGYAELASVAEKKEVNESAVQPVAWPMYGGGMPQTYIYPFHPPNYY